MKMPKLTIVIPMYNVEKFIRRCFESCLNQDIEEDIYEIIVVNDGSTDNALSIAEDIAHKNSIITIINQENKGLSGARNTGLLEARGEYIWFVDSDDWIVENCLASVCSQCDGIDVLCLSYRKVFEDSTKEKIVCPPIPSQLNGKSLFTTRTFCTPAQFYVFRRDFLLKNDLKFYEGIYHEDMEFTPRMLCLASSIKVYTTPVYNYYIRANSITTTINPKKSFDLIKVGKSLSIFSTQIVEDDVIKVLNYYISICINNALFLSKGYTNDVLNELSESLAYNKDLFKHLRNSPLLKNRIEGFAFSLFPHRCLTIYKLIQGLN